MSEQIREEETKYSYYIEDIKKSTILFMKEIITFIEEQGKQPFYHNSNITDFRVILFERLKGLKDEYLKLCDNIRQIGWLDIPEKHKESLILHIIYKLYKEGYSCNEFIRTLDESNRSNITLPYRTNMEDLFETLLKSGNAYDLCTRLIKDFKRYTEKLSNKEVNPSWLHNLAKKYISNIKYDLTKENLINIAELIFDEKGKELKLEEELKQQHLVSMTFWLYYEKKKLGLLELNSEVDIKSIPKDVFIEEIDKLLGETAVLWNL